MLFLASLVAGAQRCPPLSQLKAPRLFLSQGPGT